MSSNMIVWTPGTSLEAVEEQIIKRALQHYNGNKTMTANSLGIAIRTLDNKLEKYFKETEDQKKRMAEHNQRRADFLARCRGNKDPSGCGYLADDLIKVEPSLHTELEVDDSVQVSTLRTKKRG